MEVEADRLEHTVIESAQDGAQPCGRVAKTAGYGSTAGKQLQRGSFMRFQAKMVGSSL